MVIVKDISRFARNTVDFLQSIRQLKALNIETVFLTANQTVLGNSEFVLTIFGALAQEESANTSKRIKFGKKINAEKGRVPNFVYGYDKTNGDYFNLTVNQNEAKIVNEILPSIPQKTTAQPKLPIFLTSAISKQNAATNGHRILFQGSSPTASILAKSSTAKKRSKTSSQASV